MEITITESALTYANVKKPFDSLFYALEADSDARTMEEKIQFLTFVIRSIEEIENKVENEGNLTNWLSIVSGISGTAVIISAATLNPFAGVLTTFFGVGSALVTIGGSVMKSKHSTPVVNNFKRYKLCLKSAGLSDWAAIWQLSGTSKFLDGLQEGTSGQLFEGRLLRSQPSLNSVINYLADCGGVSPQEFINELKAIKKGRPETLKTFSTALQAKTPVSVEDSLFESASTETETEAKINFSDLRQNAIEIRDALITDSDKSRLPGCVILAAPGAGKTTFLGTAWLRLKQKHGSNFKSLAIVVKKEDVKSFQNISDQVLCVKTNPKKAAIAILKFIDSAMCSSDKISRLFLDDYLTAQKYFATGLKGSYVDLETFKAFDSKKEATEAGYFDCVQLKDAFETALNEFWLVGREYNSCVWVSSHSSNVEDLPFMGSSDARSVGDFILLAKDKKRDFIENALNNHYLITDSAKRAALKQQLNNIKLDSQEPIVLANYNNWTLGIVPSEVRSEYETLKNSVKPTTDLSKSSSSPTVIQGSAPTTIQEDSDTSKILSKLFSNLKYAETSNLAEALKKLNPEMSAKQLKDMVNIVRDKAVMRGEVEILEKFQIIKKDA